MEFKNICVGCNTYGEDYSYSLKNLAKVTNVDFRDKNFFSSLHNPSDDNH